MRYEFGLIGGGIVGLATALAILQRRPGASLVLLEKETAISRHQTGHNSGVIHSGVYYTPGSLKARMCREGCLLTKQFCIDNDIPFETPGKLVVATDEVELARMQDLLVRAHANEIEVEQLDAVGLRRAEPNIAGLGALRFPTTAIVDYKKVCEAMAASIRAFGGKILLGSGVIAIRETGAHVELRTAHGEVIECDKLVACAGLQSDRLARLAGMTITSRIVPFKGEYYTLPAARSEIVSHLIYPVPDPALPFLGVHLTRMIDGTVTVGPNAVMSYAREGYGKLSFDVRDTFDTLRFGGFWKLARDNWRSGLGEMKNSVARKGYLSLCRKYCPSLDIADLTNYSSGIRAQAVHADGRLEHDFLFATTDRMIHVLNAPSPAATSSIPIGRMIADKLLGPATTAA